MSNTIFSNPLLIARFAHETNKAICEASGDFSQSSWEEAEEWQRNSAVRGVVFKIENPTASAEDQHNAWLSDKIADGWVFGETKNPEKKTHPCLVPYGELPFSQRVKDHVFMAVVKTFLQIDQ